MWDGGEEGELPVHGEALGGLDSHCVSGESTINSAGYDQVLKTARVKQQVSFWCHNPWGSALGI